MKDLAVICHTEFDVLGGKKLLSDMLGRVKLAIVVDFFFSPSTPKNQGKIRNKRYHKSRICIKITGKYT